MLFGQCPNRGGDLLKGASLTLEDTLDIGSAGFATKRASSVCVSVGSWRVSIVSLGSDDVCAAVRAPVTPRIFVPALMFVFVNRRRQGFV